MKKLKNKFNVILDESRYISKFMRRHNSIPLITNVSLNGCLYSNYFKKDIANMNVDCHGTKTLGIILIRLKTKKRIYLHLIRNGDMVGVEFYIFSNDFELIYCVDASLNFKLFINKKSNDISIFKSEIEELRELSLYIFKYFCDGKITRTGTNIAKLDNEVPRLIDNYAETAYLELNKFREYIEEVKNLLYGYTGEMATTSISREVINRYRRKYVIEIMKDTHITSNSLDESSQFDEINDCESEYDFDSTEGERYDNNTGSGVDELDAVISLAKNKCKTYNESNDLPILVIHNGSNITINVNYILNRKE